SDDTALRGDPDLGWGWFLKHGFDIIQTDWPREVSLYLQKIKAR
ncbi:MAG: glycerophosphodiester phosphodiesterase, partial [Clostridia bacterium]|nr:glycerophosphodiester phosphodiesterase [Clostridia bacterium]